MLFAAGFGTRMGSLTAHQPKPMIPVAGKPLIDHTLKIVKDAKIDTIVANLHYLPDILRSHLQDKDVRLSFEPEILETGGGLKHALPLMSGQDVFTMNTDAVWRGPNALTILMDQWQPKDMDALLLLVPQSNAHGHSGNGDFALNSSGQLTRGGDLTYTGVQIIKTKAVQDIQNDVFSLNVVWNEIAKHGRLFGTTYPGRWCDVGHPEGIKLAEAMLLDV